jgi:CheY-like chemotaxis protein
MSRYRVLVVEDNRIEALDLIKIIQAHGYDLAGVAKSGEEAVKIAKEKNPDVILMDIKLSGEIDGITAAQAISKIDHIPIIYLTAYSDLKTIRRQLQHGSLVLYQNLFLSRISHKPLR